MSINTSQNENFPLKKAAIEFLATGSTVIAYHPFRSVGLQIFMGAKKNYKISGLYNGFVWGALSAHQLFLMGTIDGLIRDGFFNKNEPISFTKRLGIGAIAGAFSTITVTPCEMLMINPKAYKAMYRGIGPVFLRQMGLGAGMIVCPSEVFKLMQNTFPQFSENHEHVAKLGSSFTVGLVTAALTQVFEQARMMMQADPQKEKYKTTSQALRRAPVEMISDKGKRIFATRLMVIAIATIVLSTARETYPKLFNYMENRS